MDETYLFGPFRLIPAQRLLLDEDRPVHLGSRALDILNVLIQAAGETVSNSEIMARAWPATIVEESSLRVHIGALRKALGESGGGNRYITNVPGRGYAFVAPVTRGARPQVVEPPPIRLAAAGNLPRSLAGIVGRDDTIKALREQLDRHRLVTIVGPGGIGKTTVAVAVVENAGAAYPEGVWFAALAPLSGAGSVATAIATASGLTPSGTDPLSALTAWLRDRQVLIVLDNCEHVIEEAAASVEAILKTASRVRILATSREPLRAEGEWLHRLGSLDVPPDRPEITARDALEYSAVQLFKERALASGVAFHLTDEDAPALCEICRKLDGLPLALELAAVRVAAFGIHGLSERLNDRFGFLITGRRTALARQQTLRATFDWSYELLPAVDKLVLQRLAVFRGSFGLDEVRAVIRDRHLTDKDIVESIANLSARSLVAIERSDGAVHHRLLDMTRAYASEKLVESGEGDQVSRRHAAYYRDLFEQAAAEAETGVRTGGDWLATYRPHTDNVRAALQWAFSPGGDTSVGVALTVASVSLWINLSMMGECRRHVEYALARLQHIGDSDPRREMHLHAALGMSLNYTTGPVSATEVAWGKALAIAQRLGDVGYQLRGLRGLWAHHMNAGQYRPALALASEFRQLAATSVNRSDLDVGDRMAAMMLHYLGDQKNAARHIEKGLARPDVRQAPTSRFLLDQNVTLWALSARILWLQGAADKATHAARSAVDRASAIGHTLSLCHALAQAVCPIALHTGDLQSAEDAAGMLLEKAKEQGLAGWIARGRCLLGMVMLARDDYAGGLPLLEAALEELRESGAAPGFPAFLTAFADGLGRSGQTGDALTAIDQALMVARDREERWCLPEVLRVQGELGLLDTAGDTAGHSRASAEDCLRQALDCAHADGTLAWELRAAISLARLWQAEGRAPEARDLLVRVYNRFSEGFATADLRTAQMLLDQLGGQVDANHRTEAGGPQPTGRRAGRRSRQRPGRTT